MSWTWPRIERRGALLLLGAAVLLGLWLGNTTWLAMQADGSTVPWSRVYLWELTGALSAFACTWIPFAAVHNARRPAGRWVRFAATHAAGFLCFAALHTTLLIGTRKLLYAALGWGAYEYGASASRLSMEWHKDLLGYVLLAVTYATYRTWREHQRRELREARLAAELRDAQLRALVGQLSPHFLFNALNTISAVMYIDLARTDRLIADLGQLLRASLSGDRAPMWPLAEERAYTERFLAVMLARFEDRLRARWEIEDGVGAAQVPRFSLQLLVENAIKHNEGAGAPLEIWIAARRHGGRVEIEVSDDGRGFRRAGAAGAAVSADAGAGTGTPTSTGTGLSTLRRALELCHGPSATLTCDRAPLGGARVRLTIPEQVAA